VAHDKRMRRELGLEVPGPWGGEGEGDDQRIKRHPNPNAAAGNRVERGGGE